MRPKKGRAPVVTPAEIEEYKRKGLNQSDIARMRHVTRQAVSWVKGNYSYPYSKTPREVAMENYPWVEGARFNGAAPAKRMRDHVEFMATGGVGMSQNKLRRLIGFYNKLERDDVVVEFDPSIPPIKGVSSTGGFAYRPREESDGELIIRVNEHTNNTDTGRLLWRFPPERPKVDQ